MRFEKPFTARTELPELRRSTRNAHTMVGVDSNLRGAPQETDTAVSHANIRDNRNRITQ